MDSAFDVTWQTRNGRRIVNCTCYFRGAWEKCTVMWSEIKCCRDRLKMRTKRTEADMDEFLMKLGLWRKPIARDGYSLFRAVSEQVSFRGHYHFSTWSQNFYRGSKIFFFRISISHSNLSYEGILRKGVRKLFLLSESLHFWENIILVFTKKQAINDTNNFGISMTSNVAVWISRSSFY